MEDELTKEREHLQFIQDHIGHSLDRAKGEIKQTRDYTEIVLNTISHDEVLQLEKSKMQPYFAKLTFQEQHQSLRKTNACQEEIYIGRFGLFDRETLTPYVIDWRSPIANLYYEDAFQNVKVKAEHGFDLIFDVHLKRQFELKDSYLIQFFDSTNSIRSNEPLIERLRAKSEDRLKDIVETIQADQNRIIRADPSKLLIVQGVAGSGKTTIALHRLSYLAYQHKNNDTFQRFLIVGPSQLFIDYISDVLPNLGVEGVRQTTWESLLLDFLPKKIRLESRHNSHSSMPMNRALARASLLRGNLAMKTLIERFVNNLEATAIPMEDLILDRDHVMKHEQISRKFHHDFAHYPFIKRRERLITALKQWSTDCLKAVALRIENRAQHIGYTAMAEHVQKYKEHYERTLANYCKKIKTADVFTIYRKLLTNPKGIAWLIHHSGHEEWMEDIDTIIEQLQAMLQPNGKFTQEDLAGLFYLTVRLHGLDKHKPFSHIIVDEAQDLGAFQVYILRLLCNQDALSIFGDLSQSIYVHKGITNWTDISASLFTKPVQFEILKRSYRSTIEIMNLANAALSHWQQPHKVLAEPVLRHGDLPLLVQWSGRAEALTGIAARLHTLQMKGLQHIAVIAKTSEECEAIGKTLKTLGLPIHVITGRETHYEGGISVVPIYFSKGMEFDAVILLNPSANHYSDKDPIDIKLIYVAMTRALHKLYIDYWESLCKLIAKDPNLVILETRKS